MAAINRSPRYPGFNLGDAIDLVAKIYDADGRAPVTDEVAVQHMGYKGINGASLKALSAVRKYGLLATEGKNNRVTNDAVAILANRHSPNAPERVAAIRNAAFQVELFKKLFDKLGATPSERNLAAQLEMTGFTKDGSVKAARAYRATMELVAKAGEGYKAPIEDGAIGGELVPDDYPIAHTPVIQPAQSGANAGANKEIHMAQGERELTTGLLAKDVSFRLIVNGPVGVKEIERLIRKLELDKEILAEPDGDEDDIIG